MQLSSGSPQWRRYRALSSFGNGEKGSSAQLRLRRTGVEQVAAAVRGGFEAIPAVFQYQPIETLEGGVIYVDLSTAEMSQIESRIEELAAAPGVVFDLRGFLDGNVNQLSLPGGYRVSWTGMRVLKHDGSQHHLVGIRPTVSTTRTLAGVRAGRDELLERALEIIGVPPELGG